MIWNRFFHREDPGINWEDLERELAFLNINRMRKFVLITMVVELFLLLADGYIYKRLSVGSLLENYYVIMYLALMEVSLLYLLILPRLERLLQRNVISTFTVKTLLVAYFTLALVWGALIMTQRHSPAGNLSTFVVVLMLGSLLLYLDNVSLIVPYLAALLVVVLTGAGLSFNGEPGFNHYLNFIIYMVLSWFISRTLYSSYTSQYSSRCLIEVQNRLLKETNEDLVKEALMKQEIQEQLELANLELVNLSLIDDLTGIPNRRNLDFFLNYEWQRSYREQTPLSIIMIDIDCFKSFNDHYGHVSGDQALVRVARQLQACRRRSSDFVARYGGEEFLFVALNVDEKGTHTVAEMLRRQVEELKIPHAFSHAALWVTISVGTVILVPGEIESFSDAIRMADRALYEAKQAGGNTIRAFHSLQDTLF